MEWKENLERFEDSLKLAYIEDDECELDISHIPNEVLLPLIQNHIKDEIENRGIDEIQPFEGGLRIDYGNSTIKWTCCEFITDFFHWESTLDDQNDEWTKLWIGHPWIYFRIRKNKIQFSNFTDEHEINTENLHVVMELDYNSFKKDLHSKIIEMNEFKHAIIQVIRRADLTNKDLIEKKLCS